MKPSISIVIASYNQSEYLEDAIESAYNQTEPAKEIIVVDDGSTDGSLELAKQYTFPEFPSVESPVRVISQVNKGLPSARNTGIMNATGDFVLFLDADDMLLEHCLKRITEEILRTNFDIIAPSFQEFGKSERTVILGDFDFPQLKEANRLGYFCAIRRSALLSVGGYNPKMKWGWEDYDLWFDLLKRGHGVAIMQEVLVKYRVKDHSMIHIANEHKDELQAQIRKNHPELWE